MNKFHLAYSKEIDKELFDTALERRNEGGLSADNSLLRQLLLVILAKNGLMGLCVKMEEKIYSVVFAFFKSFFHLLNRLLDANEEASENSSS